MKSVTMIISILAMLMSVAHAHYLFLKLNYNNTETADYEYVREYDNANRPITDMTSKDLRCFTLTNGGELPVNGTKTLEVKAGSEVNWRTDAKVYHQGPLSIFMSRVENASTADGSGEWFKVKEIGPTFSGKGADWTNVMQDDFPVTIPKCLPAGQYLMRIQHIAIHMQHMPGREPQFHVACAQLKVTGGGKDLPPKDKMVRIPEFLSRSDHAFNVNIFMDFREYKPPGPEVWSC